MEATLSHISPMGAAQLLRRISGRTDELPSTAFDEYYNIHQGYLRFTLPESTDSIIRDVLEIISSDSFAARVGTNVKKARWQSGWQENLEDYRKTNDIASTIPKYYRPSSFLRLNGKYILPTYPDKFEYTYVYLFRLYMFYKYFSDASTVYEFGCGSGNNLAHFCRLFPSIPAIGADYIPAAVELINTLAKTKEFNLTGQLFDMENPNYELEVPANSALFTMGALEQIPNGYQSFINFAITKKFRICMHVEPIFELYDPTNLSDYLAIQFHTKRNYAKGILPLLTYLEGQGKIEICRVHRPLFGNMMQDSWSYIVWRPLDE